MWYPRLIERLVVSLLLIVFSLPLPGSAALAALPTPSPASPVSVHEGTDLVYFPETGHYVPRFFADFWNTRGGLQAFGYPLTEAFEEKSQTDGQTYVTQYFERARFERHPELAGTPFEVELGHLGRDSLGNRSALEQRVPATTSTPSSSFFSETGHSLSNGFRAFWESHGGLTVFGYPITEEITEGGRTVQYFERARFEYHPENAGTQYSVLLTLLGRQLLVERGWDMPNIVTAGIVPATAPQGGTSSLLVQSERPVSVTLDYAGEAIPVGTTGASHFALLPVESWADTGARSVSVRVTDDTGVTRQFDLGLQVQARGFPLQRLELTGELQALLDPAVVQAEYDRLQAIYQTVTPEKMWSGKFIAPLQGEVTTEYGTRRAYDSGPVSEYHNAIDIATDEGTPVLSDAPGRVVLADRLQVRGNTVIVDHGLGVYSSYYHMSRLGVKVGDMVQQGQVLGFVGSTGLSTGPHLHWEVRVLNVAVDPMQWVQGDVP
jgi:hypothetical protein